MAKVTVVLETDSHCPECEDIVDFLELCGATPLSWAVGDVIEQMATRE